MSSSSQTMELKQFQVKFVNEIYAKMRQGIKPLACVAPTGAGKTVCFSKIAFDAVSRNKTVLILVHLDILVPQTLDKLKRFGLIDIGCIKAGYPERRDSLIQVASLQTLVKRHWWRGKHFDIVIYDEAHLTTFSTIGKKIRHSLLPDSFHLGFTATPRRLSKTQGMRDHYSDSVIAATPSELQELGMLSHMSYYQFKGADLSKVRIQKGDYHPSDLKVACNSPELIQDIVKHWFKLTPDKKTLAFCVDIEHAISVRDEFRRNGVQSEVVTGETPIKHRAELYAALDNGEIKVLTSVNVVSIGFDLPSVEVGLGLRPTKSWALHMQQIGRIMRVFEGKEMGYWLDQAGNLDLGLPEDLTLDDYELDKAKKPGEGETPFRLCPECNHVNHASARECKTCGFVFPLKEKFTTPGEFVEILRPERNRSEPERFYRKKLKEAYRKGYNPIWASFKYKDQYGGFPPKEWALNAVFKTPDEESFDNFIDYLEIIRQANAKPINWTVTCFILEFGAKYKQTVTCKLFDRIPDCV